MNRAWNVVDLFSGAGGMSFGFHSHGAFRVIGAVDKERGKPSSGDGSLECNSTYEANIGLRPMSADVRDLSEGKLREYLQQTSGTDHVDVLISCAPCTGFSRVIRRNLVEDDYRNSLVSRSADFVKMLRPSIFVMENVGELLEGKFTHHFQFLKRELEETGYELSGRVHTLSEFGVPQMRKRALIIAARRPFRLRALERLWDGFSVNPAATTVRRAISSLPPLRAGEQCPTDTCHVSPSIEGNTLRRLQLIPKDGGSWMDTLSSEEGWSLLIPSMRRHAERGKAGPHPDVYGRLAWDRPAATIKRECSHTGNGRYAHPDQDRMCTVRELAILQGFPCDYQFVADSVSNMYRHVGDAVPPIVSYQIAHVCAWILSGKRPAISDVILPKSHLNLDDIVKTPSVTQLPLLQSA